MCVCIAVVQDGVPPAIFTLASGARSLFFFRIGISFFLNHFKEEWKMLRNISLLKTPLESNLFWWRRGVDADELFRHHRHFLSCFTAPPCLFLCFSYSCREIIYIFVSLKKKNEHTRKKGKFSPKFSLVISTAEFVRDLNIQNLTVKSWCGIARKVGHPSLSLRLLFNFLLTLKVINDINSYNICGFRAKSL